MNQSEQIEKICQRPLENDQKQIDAFIGELQHTDASLIETIRILIGKLKIGLAESRDLVLDSTAWSDHKESFYAFNYQALKICSEDADKIEENGDRITLTFDLVNGKSSKDV